MSGTSEGSRKGHAYRSKDSYLPKDRCVHIRRDGGQCCNAKYNGSDYCRHHYARNWRQRGAHTKTVRLDDCTMFYSKRLGPTLQKVLEDQLARPPAEQFQLYEECALIKEIASDAVVMYDACKNLPDDTKGKGDAVLQAGSIAREALKHVVDTVDKAAKVELGLSNKITVGSIGVIVNQMVRIAYEVMGDDLDKARQFEKLCREQIKLPTDGGPQGTSLTPDQDVQAMDDTVPGAPNE